MGCGKMGQIDDIQNRFLEETLDIYQYVNHISSLFRFYFRQVEMKISDTNDLISLMENYNFEPSNASDVLSNKDILEKVIQTIQNMENELFEYIDTHRKIEIPEELAECAIVQVEELVEMQGIIYTDFSADDEYEKYLDYLNTLSPENIKTEVDSTLGTDEFFGMFGIQDYEDLIEYCKLYYYNRYVDSQISEYNSLVEIHTMLKSMMENNPVNIFRQGFLLIVTAFDAALFDIVEAIMKSEFFTFFSANTEELDKSYKLKDIVSHGSFESLRDTLISDLLKKSYARDVLRMMRRYKTSYLMVSGNDKYNDILEIISRRNVHIHRRGFVDKEYFNKAEGNIFNLSDGDYAPITRDYFSHCYTILTGVIDNIPDIR